MAPVWEGLAGFVDAALQHWHEPDQGIWEVRGDPKHFTASKMMCWVAASRGADIAEERGAGERAKRWRAGADEIKAEILDKGLSSRGVFRQHAATGQHLGNFPQAFTHLALIEAVSMLIQSDHKGNSASGG